ncbi:hypothetical protein Pflav_083620 [Phytohabitans flavus]|uniref:Uncharacterized protein n=1 Tax=Phytohabitans flavus TaxID=1076124 RepID=A0A6F8Y759_9ACTN|nr:GGDEF domain-containing protein [Phytohabitans flavus]BCB81952.1 hypothetical protein Pflav_083620 [Phytohabitans flavus]
MVTAERLAQHWARAIAWTSFVSMTTGELAVYLAGPSTRLLDALTAEKADPRAAQEIGAGLVDAHFTQPASLDRTLVVLDEQLGAYAESIGKGSRLGLLQGALAAGYAQALRERTLREQEDIYAAALAARIEAEEARRSLQEQLRHQALHDPLTDLPNRTLFFERLTSALGRARSGPRSVATRADRAGPSGPQRAKRAQPTQP